MCLSYENRPNMSYCASRNFYKMKAQSASRVFDSLPASLFPKLLEGCRQNLVCIELKHPRRNVEYEPLLCHEKINIFTILK
jgi:hypothetical protein